MFKKFNKIGKRETIFFAIGIALLVGVTAFVVYSINFLVRNTREALNQESSASGETAKFDLEGLKKLGIIKE